MILDSFQIILLKKMDTEILHFGKYNGYSYFRVCLELNDSQYLQFILDKSILKNKELISDVISLIVLGKILSKELVNGIQVNEVVASNVKELKESISGTIFIKEIILCIEFTHRNLSIGFEYNPKAVSYLKGLNLGFTYDAGTRKWNYFGGIDAIKKLLSNFPDKQSVDVGDNISILFHHMNDAKTIFNGIEPLSINETQNYSFDKIDGLTLNLFEYQKKGVEFLSTGNRLLADDMGTGKTVQSLATILIKKHNYIIVVCPKVVLYNWKQEILKYIEGYSEDDILIVDGNAGKRKEMIDSIVKRNKFFLLYSYDSLKNDIKQFDVLKKVTFDCVVADEAHYIGTFKNKRREALAQIKAKHKIALTGTPFSNKLFHLWGILNFLDNEKYNNFFLFANSFFLKGQFGGFEGIKAEKKEQFFQIIGKTMLRRLKSEVLKDLPERIFSPKYLELNDTEKKQYLILAKNGKDQLANYMFILKLFEIETGRHIITKNDVDQSQARLIIKEKNIEWNEEYIINPIFKVINSLRKALVNPESLRSSTKTEFVNDIVENYQETKRNIIILSTFRDTVETLFTELSIKYGSNVMIINGGITGIARSEIIDRFQTNSGMVLVATTESVGIGVNLTNADTIVYIDQVFDDKKMKQANDRVYRIGQKNNVQIITLMYENTIDSFVHDILLEKQDIVDDWYNSEEPSCAMRDKFIKHLSESIDIL